jgi:hypothetical protein
VKNLLLRMASLAAESDDEPGGRADRWNAVALARLVVSTAFLLAVFLVLDRLVVRACTLTDSAPASDSILAACVAGRWPALIPGLAVYSVLLLAVPRLRQGWSQFEGGASLRWFVGALVVVLAWAGAGYAYNAWYDRFHGFDRVAIVLLAALVFWRPGFVLPFVVALWPVLWQFQAPQLGFQVLVADFRPLVNVLTLFTAAMLVQGLWGRRRMHGFLFGTLCIVAANFWVPGYAKLHLGWFTFGHLYLLLPNAYTHGWLAFLQPHAIESLTRALAWADWPMRIGTLSVECGAIAMFASPRVARALLLGFTLMLGLVFLTIGYFFLKWIVLQLAILWLLFRRSHTGDLSWRRELFTRHRLAISLVVIANAGRLFSPAALAWFDTPLTSTIRYEGVGRSGAVYDLPPRFFAPYESQVAMALFTGGLTRVPILAGAYGVSGNRKVAEALFAAPDPAGVMRLEDAARHRDGQKVLDASFEAEFDDFVRRTAEVSNRRLFEGMSAGRILDLLHPPPFFWTFERGRPYRHEEPLGLVRIYLVSSLFDGRAYIVFRKEALREVAVSSSVLDRSGTSCLNGRYREASKTSLARPDR